MSKRPCRAAVRCNWPGATSQGEILGSGNLIETNELKHDGTAYQLTLSQPLPFFGSTVRARYQNASEGFLNPFGGTVTPVRAAAKSQSK